MLQSPVLFLVFNRPEVTRKVFAAIRAARPRQLFVAADGPRKGSPKDAELCFETRKVVDLVDWDCDVNTLYREQNLGCREAVSSAVDWFFSQVDEGIILEDDCLPSPTFFTFCSELLERYRNDQRVMQICGANFLRGWRRRTHSYYFSLYGPIWGWATWRRAWRYYDVSMKLWPQLRSENVLDDICLDQKEVDVRSDIYDRVCSGSIDTWDYQWGFAKMVNSGLSVTPVVNLVSNIGFGGEATHCGAPDSIWANLPVHEMVFPLRHPAFVCRDTVSDRRYIEDFMINSAPPVRQTALLPGILRRLVGKR